MSQQSEPRVAYVVPWMRMEKASLPLDIESAGYKVFLDMEKCVEVSRVDWVDAIETHAKGEPYIGPCRPLYCFETPFDFLPNELKAVLEGEGFARSHDAFRWRGEKFRISDYDEHDVEGS